MNDDRLETELRSFLAGRDPGAAPARLHQTLREVPTTVGRSSSSSIASAARHMRPLAVAFGTLTVVVAVVAVGALVGLGRLTSTSVGPGASGATPSSAIPFDPTTDGAGIASPPNDLLIPIVVGGCGVLAVATVLRPTSRRTRAAVSVLIAVAMTGAFYLRSGAFVSYAGGASAAGLGYVDTTGQAPSGMLMFVVGPGGVLTYGFDVTNVGPLPIDLLGLAPAVDGGSWKIGSGPSESSFGPGSLTVTAAGLTRDQDVVILEAPYTRPFERVHLAPGAKQFVILAARAGRCALGRDNRGDPEQSNDSMNRVGVVYEVLGVRAMSIVTLPEPLLVPLQVGCDPTG
jgi:hypothetical protein